MRVYEFTKNEFCISTDNQKIDVKKVHHYLSNESYWAKKIPLEVVARSIENSFCFGIYIIDSSEQIGFARVITDKATFAYLADVFISEQFRGAGLSKWLMETIISNPELQGLRRWMLATRDAHGLYAGFGFEAISNPERLMQKLDPEVYSRIGQ